MKPSEFNDEQVDAIESRDCSILVSAPAGSGKTKILVRRILSLLKDDYYDIDQLLVLTFTKAAAYEMKQRLQSDLLIEIQNSTDEKQRNHLLKQNDHLDTAYITNFHGFCSLLLEQYGYLIQLPSDFTICSDTTTIKNKILDECIEKWLQEEDFYTFIRTYYPEYNFSKFKESFFKLYTLYTTTYDFDQYIKDMEDTFYYPIINQEPIESWQNYDLMKQLLMHSLSKSYNKIMELKYFCEDQGITSFTINPHSDPKKQALLSPYESLLQWYHSCVQLLENNGPKALLDNLPKLPKAYTMVWDDEIKPLQSKFSAKKTDVTKGTKELLANLVYSSYDEFSTTLDTSLKPIQSLTNYVKDFEKAFSVYKQAKNILDFNDLEKYALLLLDNQYGVSKELNHRLKEIMIDEYQDTNQIQETLISKISTYASPIVPCFMVGDMKQSIYRFRQADPRIFKQKYDTFIDCDPSTKRIDLLFNYRSNKIVLDSINYIFNQVMDTTIGGLEYLKDDSAKLNYDYLRKEKASDTSEYDAICSTVNSRLDHESRFTTELLLTSKTLDNEKQKEEYEAILVAKRIHQLVKDTYLDNYDGSTRLSSYKDIVVLMRSTTDFVTYKKVFDRYGIPNNMILSQGFLSAPEVIDCIYGMLAINQPNDDLAFTSLLTGNYVFSHFDESWLIELKTIEASSMYQKVLKYQELYPSPKVEQFLEYFSMMQAYSNSHTCYEILTKFLQDSQYMIFVSALINGKQRVANLELLLDMMKSYDNSTLYMMLQDLLDQIEKDIKLSPGILLSTKNDAVTFTTIHKSKGLEYPIVFVCQTSKEFNMLDLQSKLLFDRDAGITTKPQVVSTFDFQGEVVYQYENKYHQLLSKLIERETKNEEMRILYVALTRASQKLICTASIKEPSDIVNYMNRAIVNNDEVLSHDPDHILLYDNCRDKKTYLDWILGSLVRHPDFLNQCVAEDWEYLQDDIKQELHRKAATLKIYPTNNDSYINTMHAKFSVQYIPDEILEAYPIPSTTTITKDYPHYHETKQYSYPHDTSLEKTVGVTSIVDDQNREYSSYDKKEELLMEANDIGTLIHHVLEVLHFQEHVDLEKQLQELYPIYYNDTQIQVIESYKENLQAFFDSDLYTQINTYPAIFKEKHFTLKDEQGLIIHGIFDLICMNDTTIHIIDYKTDRLKQDVSDELLQSIHKQQMDYYRTMMSQAFPHHTIITTVYYLHIHQSITL